MAYTPGVARACASTDELVSAVAALAPSFGGINLEDIDAALLRGGGPAADDAGHPCLP